MAQVCHVCGKRPGVGFNVSHAHNKTKRRWLPNLQKLRIREEGKVRSVRVCTKCIKANKVTKAV